MMFVHASSTPSTIRVRSFSLNGRLSRKPRTKFRIRARFPVWLQNSTFLFFIGNAKAEHTSGPARLCNRKSGGQQRRGEVLLRHVEVHLCGVVDCDAGL